MLDNFYVQMIVGAILGTLTGLGIGGGSLLILWLTMVLRLEHNAARGINLLFFLPAAAIACVLRWKQGAVKPRNVLPAMLAGCIAAAVCSWVGLRMDMTLLKKLFGGLLIVTGLRELLYRTKKE